MTKKIRLIDESTVSADAPTAVVTDTLHTDAVETATVKQLMKYLEAIDWKLWEMLKIMKAQQEEVDEADSVDDDNLPG